ncbi:MAG: patatin-like phospholipase family protein [Desulfobacteraceae bacterium]
MKKIGLSLGGGGAKGLSHIAFLKVLDELDVKPSIISGTSIGAVAGAFYASGMSGDEIHEKIKGLKFLGLLKFMDLFGFRQSGIFSGKGVEKYLEENLSVKYFEDLKIPLKIVAADFWERKQIVFSKGALIPAIRSSVSMPGIFSPVEIGRRVFIDGSVVNPLPFDVIRHDCDVVAAIDVSGEKTPKNDKNFPGIVGTVLNTFQIMQSSIVAEKIRRNPPDIYIKPRLENFKVLEFDKYEEILLSVSESADEFRRMIEETIF